MPISLFIVYEDDSLPMKLLGGIEKNATEKLKPNKPARRGLENKQFAAKGGYACEIYDS